METRFGIIKNQKPDSHLKEIMKISKRSDELVMVSPFLSHELDALLAEMPTINKLTVYTVFEGYHDALNKAESVLLLFKCCESNNIQLSVKINEDLHGKIYMFYQNGIEVGFIVTSANFTRKGLTDNYEWGVYIDDPEQQKLIRSDTEEMPVFELGRDQIKKIQKAAEAFKSKNPAQQHPEFKIGEYINKKPLKAGNTATAYYLKPIGVKGDPFIKGKTLKDNDEIGFSSHPRNLSKGDILICHSVGTGYLVGYYKITSDHAEYRRKNDDKWPWKVPVECISISFSREWWEYELKTSDLVREYKELYPNKHVTYKGGDTLGAIRFGSQKIRLTEEFAAYLIDRIDK
jgi:hypothetical protein